MSITVRTVDQYILEMELRMPFHFGSTTLTELPQLLIHIECGDELAGIDGVAAEGLSPLWFLRNPDITFEEGLNEMLDVVDAAISHAKGVEADTVFNFWQSLYDRQREWACDTDYPPLLWSFAVSLVERAVIDAFCRMRQTPFSEAVRKNTLGV